jgi:hypothetical protein
LAKKQEHPNQKPPRQAKPRQAKPGPPSPPPSDDAAVDPGLALCVKYWMMANTMRGRWIALMDGDDPELYSFVAHYILSMNALCETFLRLGLRHKRIESLIRKNIEPMRRFRAVYFDVANNRESEPPWLDCQAVNPLENSTKLGSNILRKPALSTTHRIEGLADIARPRCRAPALTLSALFC